MNRNSDVVCPDCGADIIWENEGRDITGAPGDDYPVDCVNGACGDKGMMWAPIPRAEYVG